MFLHGEPFLFAPKAQTHVPMVMWVSEPFRQKQSITSDCLEQRRTGPVSRDNVFHAVLGMHGVETTARVAALDLFDGCRISGRPIDRAALRP